MNRCRILVVDDDPDNVEITVRELTDLGYEPVRAHSGAEALQQIDRDPPDVVLLDVMMPELSGIEVCRLIREKDLPAYLPVVMLTARSAAEHIAEGLDAGADDYLIKPADPTELAARIRTALRFKQAQDRLRYAAAHDSLTGHRLEFEQRLHLEFRRARRHSYPLSCLLCDLDQFKRVNDTHGHQVGDKVLVDVAGILAATLRESDVLARYGGEEFMILLPFSDEAGAVVSAERIRDALAGHAWPPPVEDLDLTVSIGVATGPGGGVETEDELIFSADKALYAAKQAGRNCVAPFRRSEPVAEKEAPPRTSEAPRVLIVDDDPDALDIFSRTVRELGAEPLVEADGSAALRRIDQVLPDLILLDVLLPGMDGLEVCRQLRQEERTRDIPVILVSGKTETESVVAGLEAGANDYVTKPFLPEELAARTKAMLAYKRLVDEVVQARRLKAVAGLVVTLAHEIRNPLTAVIGNAELLQLEFPGTDPKHEQLGTMVQCGKRIGSLLDRLVSIQRIEFRAYSESTDMLDVDRSTESRDPVEPAAPRAG